VNDYDFNFSVIFIFLGIIVSSSLFAEEMSISWKAEKSESYVKDNKIVKVILKGNVEIKDGLLTVKADEITYNRETGDILARGKGVFLQKGKKQGDRSNCSYYIKFVFEEDADVIESQLSDSIVEDGVQYADLSPKQKEMRNRRLKKAEAEKSKRIKKAKNKKFDTPEKVVGKKEDADIQKKIADKRDSSAERVKEIRSLISDLRKDVKDGLITKKFYQKEVAKLTKKLEKGGKI
jgi:hypothetical protein